MVKQSKDIIQMILDKKKTLLKIRYISNMSNSMILAAILKIFKLGHYDVISQLANIGFRIQHTKIPLV